ASAASPAGVLVARVRDSALGPLRDQLLGARGVDRVLALLRRLERLLRGGDRFGLLAGLGLPARQQREVVVVLLDLERTIEPLLAFAHAVLVVERERSRLVGRPPIGRARGVDRGARVGHRLAVGVHRDRDRHAQLLPAQHQVARRGGEVLEREHHPLLRLARRRRLHLHPHHVLLLVVLRAPHVLVAIERDDPLVLAGNGRERVGAGRELLTAERDLVGGGERGGFVGAGAPRLVHGNQVAPDGAALHARTAVGDGEIGESDRL